MVYRDNVCAVIRKKSDNSVLICHRKGFPKNSGWQFPQGGIDKQKNILEELKRELREEIGTDNVSVITINPHAYQYDFPEDIYIKYGNKYRGQKQRWALITFNADESEINFNNINAEFDAFKWVPPQEALSGIVDFKKKVYQQGLHDLGLL